jgi:hypothetical protein
MKNRTFVAMLAVALVLISLPLSAVKINAVKVGSTINVTIDDKFFTCYVFSPAERYPFLFPLNGPLSGASVTSMRNEAYPHHSSLFLACDMVNGGNYFYGMTGLERGQILSVNAGILKEGGDTVIITDECIWWRPGAISPMKDTRRITITAPSSTIRQIDFDFTLDMLTDVHIPKTGHSLFCARMASDLSVIHGGNMISAEGAKNEKENWGKKSAWIDYFGKRDGVIEGLAIMQHPLNPWYPSPWFARDYGFFSPGPMNWPENGVETFIPKGEKLSFRYRVIIHSGDQKEAKIAELYEKFINEK